MSSVDKYDRLEETSATGDKDDLIDNETPISGVPRSESGSSGDAHNDLAALKKKKREMMEAGKAVMADQTRGLRIIVICAFVFSIIITVALILSIYLGSPQIGANAAVAADVSVCSDMGLKILKEGGNGVDAAVASVLCIGVVNAESSGLGGGGFMLVHDHKNEVSHVYDFRETAPALAKTDMFKDDTDGSLQSLGTLSIGVPGELRGMEAAHKQYGKLSWENVVGPAAELAKNGFKMTGHTAMVLKSERFNLSAFKKSMLAKYYTDLDGNLKKEGDTVTRPDLAATLERVAEEGADALYTGSIAGSIVKEVANAENPGILTLDDLRNYKVEVRDVVQTSFKKYTIESVPAPGSGPALLSIINYLEGYKLKQDNVSYHRILEAFKFAYAEREKLGDPAFNKDDIIKATNTMISKEEAVRLRNATTDKTMESTFYTDLIGLPNDAGTAQVSVIDTSELIVSVTTSVNEWFGSMVLTDTGILLNNVMKDFSPPGNKLNEIEPGKRPLSSMVPTVVYETGHLCGLRMVLGGTNGTRILTGVAQVLLNNLTFGLDLKASVDAPRIHSQLVDPDAKVVEAEEGFSPVILDALTQMGHVVQKTDKEQSQVTAVLKVKDNIEAVSDSRKGGAGAAIFR